LDYFGKVKEILNKYFVKWIVEELVNKWS
jgi:hypothetical protein